MKFNKSYKLFIQSDTDLVVIEPPFTVDFDIQRNMLADASTAQIKIYNLSKENRNKIRKDRWDWDNQKKIEFKAGYGKNLKTIAVGNIMEAQSERQGVDFITTITSYDGGFAFTKSKTNISFPKETQVNEAVRGVAKDLKKEGVGIGSIGLFPGKLSRGTSFSGNTINVIQELVDASIFIDNNNINILNEKEASKDYPFLISSKTGLLGSPKREDVYVRLDLIFEPSIKVGQIVTIQVQSQTDFNGNYRVQEVFHKGVISESVESKVITSLGLRKGNFIPV